jgi:hypothetical protein
VNPRKRKDTGTPAPFKRVPAAITEEQREAALVQLATAVDCLNRAKRAVEKAFPDWPLPAYSAVSPRRLVLRAVSHADAAVSALVMAADHVLELEPTA